MSGPAFNYKKHKCRNFISCGNMVIGQMNKLDCDDCAYDNRRKYQENYIRPDRIKKYG